MSAWDAQLRFSRIVQDGWAQEGHGIGVDETTAVLVDADGHSRVVGKNSAYFMTLGHRPDIGVDGKFSRCEPVSSHPAVIHSPGKQDNQKPSYYLTLPGFAVRSVNLL